MRCGWACAGSCDAITDAGERQAAFEQAVAAAYERGSAVNMAAYFEIDDVIDPADSRRWIATLVDESSGKWWERAGKKRPNVDSW